MKIEVIGCHGNVAGPRHTTAYLANDRVLFDAGTVTEVLSGDRLRGISHVCVTHVHLDHIKGLCCLAEELSMDEGRRTVTVVAVEEVIGDLARHVFNNRLWPDFTAIPDRENPIVRMQPIGVDEYLAVGPLSVKAIAVNHRVPTTGFLMREDDEAVMITSDTGVTHAIWEAARRERADLIIAHVAFPSRLPGLAAAAGHMTPSVLFDRIDRFGLGAVPFYVAHTKSMFEDEIRAEIGTAGRPNIHMLDQGAVLVPRDSIGPDLAPPIRREKMLS